VCDLLQIVMEMVELREIDTARAMLRQTQVWIYHRSLSSQ